MPTIRKRSPSRLTLGELTFNEHFSLIGSWWTPDYHYRVSKDIRWSTWAEYFAAYDAVREELLANRRQEGWPLFAELALVFFRTGRDPEDAREACRAACTAYCNSVHPEAQDF